MVTIRCSSLDRILSCAGSLVPTETPYNPNNPEAREGTAGHEALSVIPTGAEPDVDAIAAKHSVDRDVLAKLVAAGKRSWADVSQWYPNAKSEVHMASDLADGIELRGTTDLIALGAEPIAVLDWKLGWKPSEHPGQVRGYAYLAREIHGMSAAGYILGVEMWVRLGTYRVFKFREEDLTALAREVKDQVSQTGKQYGPGLDACKFCPRQNACAARDAWLRSGVTALEPVQSNQPVTRELLGQLYERRKLLGVALDRYDDALKVALADGPVPLPDGRRLELEDQEQDKIRASKAMPFLRETMKLQPEEADEILSVTKSGLERVLKGRVPKGKVAAAMREAMKALADAGAVEKTTKRITKVVAA